MTRQSQSGFGIVELMIAMTLGLSLSAAVIQVTLASQRSQRVLEALARLQESGRFAVSFLRKDIRMSGYMGCPNVQRIPVNVIAKNPPADLNFIAAGVLVGEDNVDANNDYDALENTDMLFIQRAVTPAATLTGNMAADNANIQINSNPAGLEADDYVFITDCITADLFSATNVSNDNGNSGHITIAHANNNNITNKLSKVYGSDAEIMGFQSLVYFVRDSGRNTPAGNPIHSLWVQARNLGGAAPVATELVEGVENMQISYGEDTNDDRNIDVYHTAATVGNWAAVLSVRIELLLHSTDDNIVGAAGEFVQNNLIFNGAPVPSDQRLRQVYSTAVAIRNRLP
ncbi:MAG: PilW family protein [Zhongshania sp.]|uniref:PilW family protein n=1 Tax=Zhongshania sp. TaxID=1971902 RepID=UPI00261BE743|nr:PilW family protein [Zhongshania sp.]MDF1692178.1 PilW family protein [Zhongshania sp.]